ncbi:MAG: hypothetical protein RR190_05210 [Bacteroidales bacterium]
MKVSDLLILLNAKLVCGEGLIEKDLQHVFASDLMSDVLTLKTDEILLVTGLCNIQTIRTAEMSDVKAILFVRGKKATEEMIELANENEIILMECPYSMYRTSGMLWEAGIPPVY